MTEDQHTKDVTKDPEEIPEKPLEQVKQEIFGGLAGQVIENLRTFDHEHIAFLNQDYGDVADMVVTASVNREFVETLYGQEIADELWGTD